MAAQKAFRLEWEEWERSPSMRKRLGGLPFLGVVGLLILATFLAFQQLQKNPAHHIDKHYSDTCETYVVSFDFIGGGASGSDRLVVITKDGVEVYNHEFDGHSDVANIYSDTGPLPGPATVTYIAKMYQRDGPSGTYGSVPADTKTITVDKANYCTASPTVTKTQTATPTTTQEPSHTPTPTTTNVPPSVTPTPSPTNTLVPSTETPTTTPTNTLVPNTSTPTVTVTATQPPASATPSNTNPPPSATPSQTEGPQASDTPTVTEGPSATVTKTQPPTVTTGPGTSTATQPPASETPPPPATDTPVPNPWTGTVGVAAFCDSNNNGALDREDLPIEHAFVKVGLTGTNVLQFWVGETNPEGLSGLYSGQITSVTPFEASAPNSLKFLSYWELPNDKNVTPFQPTWPRIMNPNGDLVRVAALFACNSGSQPTTTPTSGTKVPVAGTPPPASGVDSLPAVDNTPDIVGSLLAIAFFTALTGIGLWWLYARTHRAHSR